MTRDITTYQVPARTALGMRHVEVTPGRNVQEMDVPDWLLDSNGELPAGVLAVIADSAIGYAAVSTQPPEQGMVTTYLHLEIPHPLPTDVGVLRCDASLREVMDTGSLASGEVRDDRGRLLALGTLRALFVPGQPPSPRPGDQTRQPTRQRAVEPDVRCDGLDPVDQALGVRSVSKDFSSALLTMEPPSRLSNRGGGLHGGFGALAGERALHHAMRSPDGNQSALHLVELRAAYLRPVATDQGVVECSGEVVHRGRRVAAATGRLMTSEGKPAVLVEAMYSAADHG